MRNLTTSYTSHLSLRLVLLLLLDLEQQRAVNPGQNTTERDGRADERVQLFVPTNGELQVARCDTLDLEILGGVTGQLENFGSEVFQDGRDVHSGCLIICQQSESRVSDSCLRAQAADAATPGRISLTLCANAHLVLSVVLQKALDTTTRELRHQPSQHEFGRRHRTEAFEAQDERHAQRRIERDYATSVATRRVD